MTEEFYPDDFDVDHVYTNWLVIDAVGYIDSLRKGKNTDFYEINPVKKLSGLLRNFANNLKNNFNAGPFEMLVLWETLRKYEDNKKISQTDELAPKIALVALELKNADYLSKERLKLLENFCLNLSREIPRYASSTRSYLIA